MASKGGLLDPAPYHLLCYGTLLGTQVFQSFVGGIVSYRSLSRPQFSVLQQHLMPWYFKFQTVLPVLLAATYPADSPISPSGVMAVLHQQNFGRVLLPVSTMLACGVANWLVLGPMTTRIMRDRKHQETRDGKKYDDAGPKSGDMQRLNRQFSVLHGASALVNMVELITTVWYGVVLAYRL